MLTFTNTDERQGATFKFIGMSNKEHPTTHLISENVSLLSCTSESNSGIDSCSFYSGPSDATIFAFGESSESCGSVAYSNSSDSCGSIAYSGGTSGGAVSCSVSSSCGSSSGGCSYSC
ncbi:MAG: hypothetical protein MJ237_04155 [bacterium]|nr:hypothetical protein [bacterium]